MTSPRATLAASLIGLLSLGSALLAGTLWPAPSPAVPAAGVATIQDGARYYSASCAHCHADDATGDEGPTLRKLRLSDAHFILLVKSGIKGEMPSFAKKYDDVQAKAIAAYLRSLDKAP